MVRDVEDSLSATSKRLICRPVAFSMGALDPPTQPASVREPNDARC
jgi:hypothetical protein